jgi:DNA-binding MarR family transcriptional regulator
MTSPRHDLARLMMPLWRSLQDAEQDAVADAGLSHWHYIVLVDVLEHPGTSQKDLARRIHRAPSRVAQDVEDLHGRDLLSRRDHPRDRRINLLEVTRRGESVTISAQKRIHGAEDHLLQRLDRRQQAQLRRLLTDALDPDEL